MGGWGTRARPPHPPALQRICPGRTSSSHPVRGRQTIQGNSPSLFYTLSPKASPAPTPPPCSPFCKYVKKDKTTDVGVLAGVSPPAATFNYVIMYRERCWCSKTVWLCNFCTFAIRNIKDLFSYFKPDSPLYSAMSQEILQG